MKLNQAPFFIYYETAELSDGEYWKFLEASDEEVDNVMFSTFYEIINNISNIELKTKMIERAILFYNNTGSIRSINNKSLKIFNEEQIEDILRHILLNMENGNKFPDRYTFFLIISKISNNELKRNIYEKYFDIIYNKYNDKLLQVIDFYQNDNEIYNWLINKYSDLLPQIYINRINVYKNPKYAEELIKKFSDENVRIGIDPKIKIGLEIEANIPHNFPGSTDYLSKQDIILENYNIDTDATVPNGNEFSNIKPFTDNVKDVSLFCTLCKILSDTGYYYNEKSENAGGQINLGLDYLDSARAILNYYELFGNVEELLFYISNEAGQIIRQQININSRFKPISEIIGKRSVDEMISRDDVIQMFSLDEKQEIITMGGLQHKKNTLCLRGTYSRDLRFEIRIPNGGVNYKTWIDNIRLYGKMMEVAKKVADICIKGEATKEEELLLQQYYELQNNELNLFEKLKILMNLLFDDDKIKMIYYHRFHETLKILESNPEIRYEKYTVKSYEPSFDTVEFDEEYKSRLERPREGVYSYDPETHVYSNNGMKTKI